MLVNGNNYTKYLMFLDTNQQRTVSRVIDILYSRINMLSLFIHGSTTRNDFDKFSDLDLVTIVESDKDVGFLQKRLTEIVSNELSAIFGNYTEEYPWFGRLFTFYFPHEPLFSLDIGVITKEELSSFFVEPNAEIIHDFEGRVKSRKLECKNERLEAKGKRVEKAEFEVFHVSHKILISLLRKRLWNAFEYVNILRRLYVELLRLSRDSASYIHVGRAERDIEAVLSFEDLRSLEFTIPKLTQNSIAEVTCTILKKINLLSEVAGRQSRRKVLEENITRIRAFYVMK